jgi:3',5'-cyclic AMP phosphodiesterase CpdA
MRILAISDLHTDFRENKVLLEQLSDVAYQQDILIAAGDISDRLETLTSTLTLLRAKFMRVFYVPGNHELWVRRQALKKWI